MAVTVTVLNKETAPSGTALLSQTRVTGPVTQKRGLRGAFSHIPYIGPIISRATAGAPTPTVTHATAQDGGGVEDSTGYRKSDTYDMSGNTGGLTGGAATSVTRPSRFRNGPGATTPTAYIGDGVQGGSFPGPGVTSDKGVIDRTGRAIDTGLDRFGRTKGTPLSGAGIENLKYTNFDGRSTRDGAGGRSLGAGGRRIVTSDETVSEDKPGPAPTFGGVAAGVVALADLTGAAGVSVNVHTDDLTGGANSRKGIELAVFERGGDTDTDEALVGFFVVDGTTGATAIPGTTGAGRTLAFYARFLGGGKTPRNASWAGNIADPRVRSSSAWSARTTVTTT